jgi:hypothetical protein
MKYDHIKRLSLYMKLKKYSLGLHEIAIIYKVKIKAVLLFSICTK